MMLTGSGIRRRGPGRALPFAAAPPTIPARPTAPAHHNTVLLRLVRLSVGGLAVGVAIGLVVGS
jgi:hypothetical protein